MEYVTRQTGDVRALRYIYVCTLGFEDGMGLGWGDGKQKGFDQRYILSWYCSLLPVLVQKAFRFCHYLQYRASMNPHFVECCFPIITNVNVDEVSFIFIRKNGTTALGCEQHRKIK